MRRGLLAALAALALSLPAPAQAELPAGDPAPTRASPRAGQPFGPLRLPTITGDRWIDLASFRGSKVLLIEFASW